MAYKRQQRRDELNHPQPESAEHRRDRELFGIDEDINEEIGLKPLQDRERAKLRKLHVPKMFNQPSVMASGDKGIFVTCDMGREKKSLNELADLVEDVSCFSNHTLAIAACIAACRNMEKREMLTLKMHSTLKNVR